jgi:hypothetical protein
MHAYGHSTEKGETDASSFLLLFSLPSPPPLPSSSKRDTLSHTDYFFLGEKELFL